MQEIKSSKGRPMGFLHHIQHEYRGCLSWSAYVRWPSYKFQLYGRTGDSASGHRNSSLFPVRQDTESDGLVEGGNEKSEDRQRQAIGVGAFSIL